MQHCRMLLGFGALLLTMLFPTQVHALRPGEVKQLPAQTKVSIDVSIPSPGFYRLETKGQDDPSCRLMDKLRGVFLADKNSGNTKNCRMDVYLSKGQYRWLIERPVLKKGSAKRPKTQIALKVFREMSETVLREGRRDQQTLRALRYQSFRLDVTRQKQVVLQAFGSALHRCLLRRADGWVEASASSSPLYRGKKQAPLRRCRLTKRLEPGTYHFLTYGTSFLEPRKSRPRLRSALTVKYDARYLSVGKQHYLKLLPHGQNEFWLSVPASASPNKKPMYLFLDASSMRSRRWSVRLYKRHKDDRTGSYQGYCNAVYRGRRSYRRSCRMVRRLEAGQHYSLRVSGAPNHRFRLKMAVLRQGSSSLAQGKRVRFLSARGAMAEVDFAIKKDGNYFLDFPYTSSCKLVKVTQSGASEKSVTVRGLPLDPDGHIWRSRLTGEGRQEWVNLPKAGKLSFGTRGRGDTYCTLYDAQGRVIQNNDDTKGKRSCQIERRLAAGHYRIQVRPYNKRQTVEASLFVSFNATSGKINTPVTHGCQFRTALKSGRYLVYLGQNGTRQQHAAALYALPLRSGDSVNFNTLQGTLALPLTLSKSTIISVSRTSTCELRQGKTVVVEGRATRGGCRIRFRGAVGDYTLRLSRPSGSRYGDTPVRVKVGRPRRNNTSQWPKPKRPTSPVLPPIQTKLSAQHQRVFLDIASSQQREVSFQVSRAGMVRIESLGLLHTTCALHSEAIPQLHTNTAGGEGRNCRIVRYLTPGTYRVRLSTVGKSAGRLGLQFHMLSPQSKAAVSQTAPAYGRLSTRLAHDHTLAFQKKGSYIVRVHGIDGKLRGRIQDKEGWPLHTLSPVTTTSASNIGVATTRFRRLRRSTHSANHRAATLVSNWHGQFSSGEYRLILASTRRAARYRVTIETITRGFHPSTQRFTKEKSRPLPLYGEHNAQLSPRGMDRYALDVPSTLKVQFRFTPSRIVGRLYRGTTLIGLVRDGDKAIRLGKGRYELRTFDTKGRSDFNYRIAAEVVEASPNVQLHRRTPFHLPIRLTQETQVEITTASDQDVWCHLYNARGQLLAKNDDRSQSRWDCRLSAKLPKGRYTLHVDGKQSLSWVSIKRFKALSPDKLLVRKEKSGTLAKRHLKAYTFSLSGPSIVSLRAKRSKPGAGQLGCRLESQASGKTLDNRRGQTCALARYLAAGHYRWILRNEGQVSIDYVVSLKQSKPHNIGQGESTQQLDQQGRLELSLSLSQAQHTQLSVTGDKTLQCRLYYKHQLIGQNCRTTAFLPAGQYRLRLQQKSVGKVKVERLHTALATKGQSRVLLQTNTLMRLAFDAKKPGRYSLTLLGKNRKQSYRCRHSLATQAAGAARYRVAQSKGRCDLATTWQKQNTLWFRVGSAQAQRLQFAELTWAQLPEAPQQSSLLQARTKQAGALNGKESKAWHWQQSSPQLVEVVLHGKVSALYWSDRGHRRSCASQQGKTTHCRWYLNANEGKARVVLQGRAKQEQRYLLHRQSRQAWKLRSQLQAGQSISWPAHRQPEQITTMLRGKGKVTLEVTGGAKACVVENTQLEATSACRQTLTLGAQPLRLTVKTSGRAGQILLYHQSQRMVAIVGAKPAQAEYKGKAIPLGNKQTLNGQKAQFISLAKTGILNIAQGHGASVCVVRRADGTLLHASFSARGCRLALPLRAGNYVVRVRHIVPTPESQMSLSVQSFQEIKEGRHGHTLLVGRLSQWYRFVVPSPAHGKASKIGVGVVGQHDELKCKLLDRRAQVVAEGCRQYATLKAGEYWLRVQLRRNAPASSIHTVLRGTMPPPNKIPLPYLKSMIKP